MSKTPVIHRSIETCTNDIFSRLPNNIRLGTPLGLGKPNELLNSIYDRIKNDNSKTLHLYTALSLTVPNPSSFLEKLFLKPFLDKHYGQYPHLNYAQDIISGELPSNVKVHEFYMQAGVYPKNSVAQLDYVSLNYTHVSQYLVEEDVQVVVQAVAKSPDGKSYSLSCNPDMTLDLKELYHQNKKELLMVGVVHPDLPYMGHDAIVTPDFFDIIVDTDEKSYELFSLPKTPVELQDIWIGIHASRLVKDDGTLQIGIGSLSDSLVKALTVRQDDNETYKKIADLAHFPEDLTPEHHHFKHGLYGVSEMLMDGFMHLRKSGILKREIFDHDLERKRFLHSAFFLGSKELYQWLRNLPEEDWKGLDMTRVSKVNDLYDPNELALRRQRKNARFFNTCMSVTLLGGAASDTLENAQVVSGVGGQFNFVTMARELPDSYSVLMLRSTRTNKGITTSNIVWSQGNLTIPRHLRDVVVTEYGVANIRGKTDSEVIKRLLCITDSRFQDELLKKAKASNKLQEDFEIPDWAKNNLPEVLDKKLEPFRSKFPPFPFGSDFTPVEEKLVEALSKLKEISHSKIEIAKLLREGLRLKPEDYSDELTRLELMEPKSLKEKLYQKLVMAGINRKG